MKLIIKNKIKFIGGLFIFLFSCLLISCNESEKKENDLKEAFEEFEDISSLQFEDAKNNYIKQYENESLNNYLLTLFYNDSFEESTENIDFDSLYIFTLSLTNNDSLIIKVGEEYISLINTPKNKRLVSNDKEFIEKVNKICDDINYEKYFSENILSKELENNAFNLSIETQIDIVKKYLNCYGDFTLYFNDNKLFTGNIEKYFNQYNSNHVCIVKSDCISQEELNKLNIESEVVDDKVFNYTNGLSRIVIINEHVSYLNKGFEKEEITPEELNTIYKLFSGGPFNITYQLDSGVNDISNIITYSYNDSDFVLKKATKDGYSFIGWYKEKEFINEVKVIDNSINSDLVLYAKFLIDKKIDFKLEDDSTSLYIDESKKIELTTDALKTGISNDLNNYQIVSSDNNIIEVNIKEGVATIKGLKEGTATITLILNDLEKEIEFTVLDPFNKTNSSVSLNSKVSRDMTNPFYWINKISDNEKLLLTLEQINDYNYKCLNNLNPYNNKLTGFVDISKINPYIEKDEITTLVNKSMKSAPTTTYNSNCNISGITRKEVLYGLTVKSTSVKNVPTLASSGTNNKYQETALELGEGVAIYHTSTDNKWYFVQAYNYAGWVLKENIALCSKEQMLEYLNNPNFVMITSERITNPVEIRMGTRISIKEFKDNIATLLIPYRDNDGKLIIKEVNIEKKNENFSIGYLPYTTKNVIKQMFKMQGYRYDWGDEHGGRDCSSTLDACYKCFGFIMPRNTSSLYNLAGVRYDISNMSNANKEAKLKTLRPGSIILKSGHVMMYIGIDNNTCYIIHNISGGVQVATCTQTNYNYSNYNLYMEMFS